MASGTRGFWTRLSAHRSRPLPIRNSTPSLLEKAARLGFGLICNHPFIDGNKRIGTHAMLVFLDINQITLSYEDDDLIETILRVASGTLDYNGLLGWLQEHLE